MSTSKARVSLLLIALVLLSACSASPRDGGERREQDIRCGKYKIDRKGPAFEGGVPVVDGISTISVSENCKLEITPLKDQVPGGVRDPWKTGPPLTQAPKEITDILHVDWISIEHENPISNQYLVLPAYAFQCQIDAAIEPDFKCTGFVTATHKLSTYTDNAYELSGGIAKPLPVQISFATGQKDTHTQLNAMTVDTKMTKDSRTAWALLLVLEKEWERIGIAKVCVNPADRAAPCEVVRARVVHKEVYLVARETEGWDRAVNRFRKKIKQPLFTDKDGPEPAIPKEALHRDFTGGPLTQSAGGVVTGVHVDWRNSDTTLQSKDLKGSINIGLTVEGKSGRGRELETDSTARISFSPDSKTASIERCFEVWAVGGQLRDRPLTGMVLKEGCDS